MRQLLPFRGPPRTREGSSERTNADPGVPLQASERGQFAFTPDSHRGLFPDGCGSFVTFGMGAMTCELTN